MRAATKRHFRYFSAFFVLSFIISLIWTAGFPIERSLQLPPLYEDIPCEWSGVERIVAVGDLHGAYVYFVQILQGTGLIDENLHWIGGAAHLVQIGDVLDRGDGPKEIFDLAMRLEKEAEEAGGRVHMLIGNHEEMNLANTAFDREGYVTPKQFAAFLPEKYRLNQEKKFSRKAGSSSRGDNSAEPDYSEYWQEMIDKGLRNEAYVPRKTYFRFFNEQYGQWILSHNVVVRINDIIFVHGGISETFSLRGLKEINDQFRLEMEDLRLALLRGLQPQIPEYDREIYNNINGPLWYRGLSRQVSPEIENDLDRILANLGAKQIIIAHTPQTAVGEEQMKRYGGKVWIIDTGIADYYRPLGGHVSALVYENGKWTVWYPGMETAASARENPAAPASLHFFFFSLHPVFPSQKILTYQPEKRGGL